MDIIDSITKQIIKEGEEVTLMFLINRRSEDNSVGLMTRLHDQYKLASLPVKAKWTGYGFQDAGQNDLALVTLAKSMGLTEAPELEAVISSIWDYGHVMTEKPSWNCSPMREFSVFAIRPATLDKMAQTSTIRENVPLQSASEHLQSAFVHARQHITQQKIPNNSIPEESRIDHYMENDRLSRMFYLQHCTGYNEDYADPIPYAASSMNRSSDSVFSGKLLSVLSKERFVLPSGELDENRYAAFYEGAHLAVAITHALSFLDIPLAPCHWAQSPKRDTARLEFMSKVLIEDLSEHCAESSDYDDNPGKVIRDLTTPLKACVADMTRLQNKIEDRSPGR